MKKSMLVVLALVFAACANKVGPEYDEFADSLNINLDAMTKTASGLYYQDITEGTGAEAVPGSTVTVDYEAWLVDGTKFDSSLERGEPFTFELGSGLVIDGFDEGITGMKVGGLRKLVIPSSLAYGFEGVRGVIPRAATLVFEIELLDVVS